MSSWTTQDLSLPAITAEGIVSRNFLVRDPQYLVVEITGLSDDATTANITIEDSADGVYFTEVKTDGTFIALTEGDGEPENDSRVIFRFDASVESQAAPLRNICRVKLNNTTTFDKVFVTWSP